MPTVNTEIYEYRRRVTLRLREVTRLRVKGPIRRVSVTLLPIGEGYALRGRSDGRASYAPNYE